MIADTEPVLRRDKDVLVPTRHAVGPWDPGQLHGGVPAALIADAIQRLAPDMQVTRVAYEFLGPVPAEPVAVEARIVKPGGRLRLAEATLTAAGRLAMRASATLLRRGSIDVPEIARWTDALPAAGPLDDSHATRSRWEAPGFHTTGMTIRFANGTGYDKPGAAQAWFALERDFVAGEPLSPVARAVAAADFGNGVSSVLDWDEWLFVNCDLTVSLLRDPATPWVLLDSVTRVDGTAIGQTSSTLYDERGPIGSAQQTLFVAPR